MAMNRRIGVGERIVRHSLNGQHYYIDPIMGIDSQLYDSINEREEEIRKHYIEPQECAHEWDEISRHVNRYEAGMCSGQQQCRKCGVQTFYSKGVEE